MMRDQYPMCIDIMYLPPTVTDLDLRDSAMHTYDLSNSAFANLVRFAASRFVVTEDLPKKLEYIRCSEYHHGRQVIDEFHKIMEQVKEFHIQWCEIHLLATLLEYENKMRAIKIKERFDIDCPIVSLERFLFKDLALSVSKISELAEREISKESLMPFLRCQVHISVNTVESIVTDTFKFDNYVSDYIGDNSHVLGEICASADLVEIMMRQEDTLSAKLAVADFEKNVKYIDPTFKFATITRANIDVVKTMDIDIEHDLDKHYKKASLEW